MDTTVNADNHDFEEAGRERAKPEDMQYSLWCPVHIQYTDAYIHRKSVFFKVGISWGW